MSLLYGPDGNPIASAPNRRFAAGAERGPGIPNWPKKWEDINKSIPLDDWQTLGSVGRQLYWSNGAARALADDKATACIGDAWQLVSTSYLQGSGRYAANWINNNWMPACSVEGWPVDFQGLLFLISTALDHSGDCGLLKTTDEDGWPLLQLIPAHRIGLRGRAGASVMPEGSAYAGMRVENGVVISKSGAPVAYCLIGDTPAEDKIVTRAQFLHIYDPVWVGQRRGYPGFFHGLREGKTATEANSLQQHSILNDSALHLIVTNKDGEAPPELETEFEDDAGDDVEETQRPKPRYEEFMGGLIRYLRAEEGEDLKAHESNRPGAAWESYRDSLIQFLATGTGWPSELVWRPAQMSGPLVRSIQGRARRTVRDRQGILRFVALWAVQYPLAYMIDEGIWEQPPNDWLSAWRFTLPELITIDDGRDSQNRREDVKLGVKSWGKALEETGVGDKKLHFREIVVDAFDLEDEIRAEEKRRGYTIDRRTITLMTPNEQPATNAKSAEPANEDDGDGEENDDE
jgi:hypothetical protein